jgi:hypothetical protein
MQSDGESIGWVRRETQRHAPSMPQCATAEEEDASRILVKTSPWDLIAGNFIHRNIPGNFVASISARHVGHLSTLLASHTAGLRFRIRTAGGGGKSFSPQTGFTLVGPSKYNLLSVNFRFPFLVNLKPGWKGAFQFHWTGSRLFLVNPLVGFEESVSATFGCTPGSPQNVWPHARAAQAYRSMHTQHSSPFSASRSLSSMSRICAVKDRQIIIAPTAVSDKSIAGK